MSSKHIRSKEHRRWPIAALTSPITHLHLGASSHLLLACKPTPFTFHSSSTGRALPRASATQSVAAHDAQTSPKVGLLCLLPRPSASLPGRPSGSTLPGWGAEDAALASRHTEDAGRGLWGRTSKGGIVCWKVTYELGFSVGIPKNRCSQPSYCTVGGRGPNLP